MENACSRFCHHLRRHTGGQARRQFRSCFAWFLACRFRGSQATQWAVGIRGFTSGSRRDLLVLIDGRSVYTPLFEGVYWDVQDLPLDDIDRIEVIRGPAGAVWGANAVNGVINVITKHARRYAGIIGRRIRRWVCRSVLLGKRRRVGVRSGIIGRRRSICQGI